MKSNIILLVILIELAWTTDLDHTSFGLGLAIGMNFVALLQTILLRW